MWSTIWTYLLLIPEIVSLGLIVAVLRRPREPRAMLAWILALLFLPWLGIVLYLTMGEPRRGRHRRRRRRKRHKLRPALDEAVPSQSEMIRRQAEAAATAPHSIMTLTERLDGYPPAYGNDVTVYTEADKTFLALQLAIESAQETVHLEYYIYQPDETGRAIRDLLIDRARQGVTCRVLLDYVGCWHVRRAFLAPLRDAGIQVAFALPMVPWRGRWRVNFRNHRKIAVVDGRIGFTGSQNIGNEYSGLIKLKHRRLFRDTHLKIDGPAVTQLQHVFADDWHYTTGEKPSPTWFPRLEPAGDQVVQILPSGPDQHTRVMHQLLFAAVSTARSSISIITPYFVPDTAMLLALQSAAYRGVRVELIIPSCSDHRVTLWAGRSYYAELTREGVRIYEHPHRLLHSKVMIVDRQWAMVGSANMDERSFSVNYELTTLLYNEKPAGELYQDFEQLRGECHRITSRETEELSLAKSLVLGLSRLAAPVL